MTEAQPRAYNMDNPWDVLNVKIALGHPIIFAIGSFDDHSTSGWCMGNPTNIMH